MRLSPDEIATIKASVHRFFGGFAKVYLFGSRIDDAKRGGDIDLLVESSLDDDAAFDARLQLLGELQRRLGDQKIDIVTTRTRYQKNSSSESTGIVYQARAHGIAL
jgi:predicted nucleotidyltransferase